MDPDQTAPIGAVCSGSKLFASILNLSVMLGNFLQQTTFSDAFNDFFLGALRVKYSTSYLQLLLVVLVPSPLNANSSLESSNKRRSRKSQPQRVVSEAETPVIDLDVEEMEVDGDLQLVNNINGPQMVNVNGSKFVAHRCLNP